MLCVLTLLLDSGGYDLVMEYVEGNWIFEGCGPPGGIGEAIARKYFRDVVAGLSYLHNQVITPLYMPSNVSHYFLDNFFLSILCLLQLTETTQHTFAERHSW
jgi:hypothetical protein